MVFDKYQKIILEKEHLIFKTCEQCRMHWQFQKLLRIFWFFDSIWNVWLAPKINLFSNTKVATVVILMTLKETVSCYSASWVEYQWQSCRWKDGSTAENFFFIGQSARKPLQHIFQPFTNLSINPNRALQSHLQSCSVIGWKINRRPRGYGISKKSD